MAPFLGFPSLMLAYGFILSSSTKIAFVMSQGTFINPPSPELGSQSDFSSNPVYAVGNPLNVTWETPYSTPYDLVLWPVGYNGPYVQMTFADLETNYYYWNPIQLEGGGSDLDLTWGNVYLFRCYQTNSTLYFAESIAFNLTDGTVAPDGSIYTTSTPTPVTLLTTATIHDTTTALPTSTPFNSSPLTTTSPTTTTSSTAATSSSASSSSGLSTGAKIGAGVGAGIGALALISLAVGALWWRRRSKDDKYMADNGQVAMSMDHGSQMDGGVEGPAESYRAMRS